MSENHAPTLFGSVPHVPTRRALLSLFETLIAHQANSPDCDECQQALAEYLGTEQPGQHTRLASVHVHLATCAACAQIYLDQVELDKLETSGHLPRLTRPIRFDLSMLRSGGHTWVEENQGV